MIELKAIKVHHKLSEETYCFSANLYYKGKKVGEVSNIGCGGCHDIHLLDNSLYQELEDYAKSLPAVEFLGNTLDMDLELLISNKVSNYLEEQDNKKNQRFVDKQVKVNKAKGFKTLKLTTPTKISCIPLKPNEVITQNTIDKFQARQNIQITNWEIF